MNLLNRLVHAFIMSFGITQPTAAKQRTAALFIGLLLLSILAGFLTLAFVLIRHFFS